METSSNLNVTKARIIKNFIILCTAVCLIFVAGDCLIMLQSTLNHDKGIGVVCLAVNYACFCFSSMVFPKYTIQKLGSKRTLVISMCCSVPYVAANMYPHWSVMVPAAVLSGLTASLLWTSQCTYLNDIANLYYMHTEKTKLDNMKQSSYQNVKTASQTSVIHNNEINEIEVPGIKVQSFSTAENHVLCASTIDLPNRPLNDIKGVAEFNTTSEDSYMTENRVDISSITQLSRANAVKSDNSTRSRKNFESITARFFGIFGMAYLSSHIWSNMMSYFVLQNGAVHSNITFNISCVCGASYCNEESDCFQHNLQKPSSETRNILTALCIALSLFSILLMLFLDSLNDKKETIELSTKLLMATYKQSKKKLQILLIPISYYIGMMQGLYSGVFTVSYIGCAWGTYHVSLVAVCYGAACAVSSSTSGLLVKSIGRIPIFLFAALSSISSQVILLCWNPTPNNPIVFFIIAGLCGAALGVFWSQVKAIHGLLFKDDEEAAFSAYNVWYSLGFSLSYAYSNRLCTYAQIYLSMSVLILGIIGYLWLELITRRK